MYPDFKENRHLLKQELLCKEYVSADMLNMINEYKRCS